MTSQTPMNIESIARDTITTAVDPMSSLLDGHATLPISLFISLKKFVNLFAIFYPIKRSLPVMATNILYPDLSLSDTQARYSNSSLIPGFVTLLQVLYIAA
jgi:hypothetical protein